MEYKTMEEWGPFGECQTVVYYSYTPARDPEDAGDVTVTGGRFYALEEKWIEFGKETALNVLFEPGNHIENRICEYHEEHDLERKLA